MKAADDGCSLCSRCSRSGFSVRKIFLHDRPAWRTIACFAPAPAGCCSALISVSRLRLGTVGVEAGYPKMDFYVARILSGLLGLVALETLINLILEIYRPRVKGKVARPLYESRLVGLLGQPEGSDHHCGAGAGLSIRLQGFRDVVLSFL